MWAVFVVMGILAAPDSVPEPAPETAEFRIAPYAKGGTLAWDRLGGVGGHKFAVSGGLTGRARFRSLGTAIRLEKWWVSEGLDDDRGIIPEEGFRALADVRYFLGTRGGFSLYPYIGFGFERWKKGGNWKRWRSLRFFTGSVGMGMEDAKGYLRVAVTRPFSASLQDGSAPRPRYGFSAQGGIRLAVFVVGLYYDYAGFEDPDVKMIQSGLFVEYRFE